MCHDSIQLSLANGYAIAVDLKAYRVIARLVKINSIDGIHSQILIQEFVGFDPDIPQVFIMVNLIIA
jgi:hypothetical protein